MNKNIYLIATLFAVLFFSACEDVYDHVAADPQSNEQEAEQSVDGFSFALGSDLSTPLVLTDEMLENETILEAVSTTATPEMNEGATVRLVLEASDSEDFNNIVELNSIADGNNASILAADLNDAVKSLYGNRPDERDIYLRITYYIVDGSTSSMMPTPAIIGPITVTPVGQVIETEYYIIGDVNGWNFNEIDSHKFNHSGNDVYDDPYFTILVENLQGNFKIVPKSAKEDENWDAVLGNTKEDGNTDLEGTLIANAGAMNIEEPGWVRVTLNMMEYTYSIELIGEMNLSLYVVGSHQGWDPGSAPTIYNRNFDFKYNGFVYFPDEENEFKFTTEPNWDNEYADAGDGTLAESGDNIKVTGSGHYLINVDLSGSPFTYELEKTEWGLIGDATLGGWETDTDMTFDPETQIWSVTTELSDGEFKFRANDGWDINLGGRINDLSFGGDNIIIESGTYTITLDLSDSEQLHGSIVKL